MKMDDGTKTALKTFGGILWNVLKIGIFGSLTILSVREFLFYHDN